MKLGRSFSAFPPSTHIRESNALIVLILWNFFTHHTFKNKKKPCHKQGFFSQSNNKSTC